MKYGKEEALALISGLVGLTMLIEPSREFVSPVWAGVRSLFRFAAPFEVNAAGGVLLAATVFYVFTRTLPETDWRFEAAAAGLMGLIWTALGGVALRIGIASAQTSSTAGVIFLFFAVSSFRIAVSARRDSR